MGKILIGILLLIIGYMLWNAAERSGNWTLSFISTFIYFAGFVIGGLGIADFKAK